MVLTDTAIRNAKATTGYGAMILSMMLALTARY